MPAKSAQFHIKKSQTKFHGIKHTVLIEIEMESKNKIKIIRSSFEWSRDEMENYRK